MTKKKIKSLRNQPEIYEEVKQQYSLALTPTGRKRLQDLANEKGLSASEFIEQICRGIISLN